MPRIVSLLVLLLFLTLLPLTPSSAEQTTNEKELEAIFTRSDIKGTFVLYTPSLDKMILVNPKRANKRYIPASTFKIANSIIALETGVIKNVDEIIQYGGKPQPIKSWERDMSMRDAIRISNVPIYQNIANRVGRERYLQWLQRLEYGNRKVGKNVHRFWLRGPLKISAVEQVKFVARLAAKELPASKDTQSVVAEILEMEYADQKTLFGKTGWTNASDPGVGWFVGWVTGGKSLHVFALNIDVRKRADAKQRKLLTLKLLRKVDIY